MDRERARGVFKLLWTFRKSVVIVLTPLALLPIPLLHQTSVAKCAYMICVMAIYWVTEACPLAVTSLLPVVVSPFLGLQEANTVTMNYMKHTSFLIVGTLIMCIAIEESGLHRRVALKVLIWFGSQPCWILLGLMIITGFLSMWLMNLSTVSLMLPITLAVCNEWKKIHKNISAIKTDKDCERVSENIVAIPGDENDLMISGDIKTAEEQTIKTEDSDDSTNVLDTKIEKAMLFGICYSSTIGGVSTVIGTPTNLIALGIYRDEYDNDSVNFLTWLCFCLPISIVGLIVSWIWIQIRFLRISDIINCKKKDSSNKRVGEIIKKMYDDLPAMSFAEKAVGIHFLILVLLWVFRDPRIFPGWNSLLEGGLVRDSTTAVLVGLSVFLFPSKSSSFSWLWRTPSSLEPIEPSPSLLEWNTFQRKFPWDILILMGSGFAIAGSCVDSGLSNYIGNKLVGLEGSPVWLILLAMSAITSITTEFTSNSATIGILLPTLLPMSQYVGITNVEILLAVTLSASFAFCLPVATPANALVFSTGSITIPDMFWTGLPLNFVFVILLNIMIPIAGPSIFLGDDVALGMNGTLPNDL